MGTGGLTVAAAGVDTWSCCWYVNEGTRAAGALDALATVPASRSRWLEEKIAGHRIGYFAGSGLVVAEGHPAAALGGTGLGCPDRLPEAVCAIERALWDYGIRLPLGRSSDVWAPSRPQTSDRQSGFAGVRRCDATADLHFDSGADGLAVLAGVAAVLGADGTVQRKRGHIETVTMKAAGGRKTTGRWYDKSTEALLGPRGSIIRPEDQRRWPKAHRRDVNELTTGYVRDKFCQRFVPLWRATKGVTVGGPRVLTAKIVDLVNDGEMTGAEALRAGGYLLFGEELKLPRKTEYRHRRLCADNGLVLADGALQEVDVDLHGVLEQVLEAECWGGPASA